jgi:hypothetical protein
MFTGVHNAKVQEIQTHIGGYRTVVPSLLPESRSQERRLRASAQPALVIFYRHICDESAGFLQARTIATRFNTHTHGRANHYR